MNRLSLILLLSLLAFLGVNAALSDEVQSVTQYGITWTFDKPYPAGRFVTGDWWVIGPVTVTKVTPAPGPASADEPATSAKSLYGATSLSDDKTWRNGSMVILGPTKDGNFTGQGYDSRLSNFDRTLSVHYPYELEPGRSLISTISSETYKDGKLATPYIPGVFFPDSMARGEAQVALDTAAVLTCLDKAPPADAFRPPYAGVDKPLYETKEIQWGILPNLKPVASTPDWDKMARVFERPWLDHIDHWLIQFTAPGQNQAAYGGVVTRMNAYASLMLLLDAPKEQKQKLMIGFLQYGIDLSGLSRCGRQWASDGGHWMGRKWPILFASFMLNKPGMRAFPPIDASRPILYKKIRLDAGSEGPKPTTLFSEDMDTYYGKGAAGQDVLWQVVFHTHARQPYMEKPYSGWTDGDKFVNNYFWTGGNWSAFALSALYLKAKAGWNHDAFFDYCDWFMKPGQATIRSRDGHAGQARYHSAKFVQEMWDAYRAGAPGQPGGADNLKWVWTHGTTSADGRHFHASKGHWIGNPKPSPQENAFGILHR